MLYESVQQPPEIVTLTKRKTEKAEVLESLLSDFDLQKRKISARTWRWFGDKWGRIRWFYLWLVNFVALCLKRKNEISEVSHHTKQNWKLTKKKRILSYQQVKTISHLWEPDTHLSYMICLQIIFCDMNSFIDLIQKIYSILLIFRNEKWTKSPFGPYARMIYPGTLRFK